MEGDGGEAAKKRLRQEDDGEKQGNDLCICEGGTKPAVGDLIGFNCLSLTRLSLVNRHNMDSGVFDMVSTAVHSCDFYAVDTEFSGLDRTEGFRSPVVQTRYESYRRMVEKYAILQFGLCFCKRDASTGVVRTVTFTFQIVQLDTFSVAPHSLIFLAEGGLSLTDVFKRGIQFNLGEPSKLRDLWHVLAASRKPLIMHNGLADLLFIWKTFFSPLPPLYSEWLSAFLETFPGGVYDTKLLAEQVAHDQATYLQHMFHTAILKHSVKTEPTDLSSSVPWTVLTPHIPSGTVCANYAKHGNCRRGVYCPDSHDVEYIVGLRVNSRPNHIEDALPTLNLKHTAGFDAYATAYVYLSILQRFGDVLVGTHFNQVYLMHSTKPLLLIKSKYE
jgi:hypothetical protein